MKRCEIRIVRWDEDGRDEEKEVRSRYSSVCVVKRQRRWVAFWDG